jgi:selenocysteine lyase/cysteine desulfurase
MNPERLQVIRDLFPVLEKHVYFNHAGTGPLPRPAVQAVSGYAEQSAREGKVPWPEAEGVVGRVRVQLAELLHVEPRTVAFTKNTSAGIIIAINSIDWQEGDNVVLMEDAFPAVTYPFHFMLPHIRKRWVTARQLVQGPDCVFDLVDNRTRCVALPWVHFLTGSRFDVATVARFCRERGVFTIIDAIQGIGVVDCDWTEVGTDFVSGGGTKWLLSPQGTGFIHVRPDTLERIRPANHGWLSAHWENFNDISSLKPLSVDARRFEEGTKNYLGIYGQHESLAMLLDVGIGEVERRVRMLTARLRAGLEANGWEILTPADPDQNAGIVTCRKEGINPASVLAWLTSANMVCALRENLLRISPHFYDTEEEVDRFLGRMNEPGAATAAPADCST